MCAKELLLLQSGVLRRHSEDDGEPCPGSLQEPAATKDLAAARDKARLDWWQAEDEVQRLIAQHSNDIPDAELSAALTEVNAAMDREAQLWNAYIAAKRGTKGL